MEDTHLPLIVCDESGKFLFLAYTDKKGYKKSLEKGTLYATHPESDHLLPNGNEGVVQRIEDRGSYFYAEVSFSTHSAGTKKDTNESIQSMSSESLPSDLRLSTLLGIIKERKFDRPKGSYTGQLFDAGIEKIRKKLGEEAIELILSRKREEAIVEAADLLFHLLVLLEAENIDFSQVLEELSRRL